MTSTRNEKKGILLVAFGTSGRLGESALAGFSRRVQAAFPDMPVRWAFTSDRVRSRMAAERKKTDSVHKALCRMGFERFERVAVQSLHLIPGVEYEAVRGAAHEARRRGGPGRIAVGAPLLCTPEDLRRAADALFRHLPAERTPDQAVVCMGHGTWHAGGAGYESLARRIARRDPRIFLGTLEGEPSIERIIERIRDSGARGVWLLPLLALIGKHAMTDMAGDGPDSWRSKIEAAGFPCRPVLRGAAEYEGFADLWLAHLATAVRELEPGGDAAGPSGRAPEPEKGRQ